MVQVRITASAATPPSLRFFEIEELRRFACARSGLGRSPGWTGGSIGGARGGALGHKEAIGTSLGCPYGSGKGAVCSDPRRPRGERGPLRATE